MNGCVAALYGDAVEDEERLALLDKVFEMGCTFWDTAGEAFFNIAFLLGWNDGIHLSLIG